MYLVDPAENAVIQTVWNLSGGSGGLLYIIGLIVLVLIVMHITYGIYRLIDLKNNRR
jgi:uncharacterized membrane protein